MATIIGITGVSGAGKTTISRALAEKLNKPTVVFWDDYDDLTKNPTLGPDDYIEWYRRGGAYDEWKSDSLEHTLQNLKEDKELLCPVTHEVLKPSSFVIFDTGLGYHHLQTGQYIDYLVFLDTPLDICLCRRIIRDFSKTGSATESKGILEDLSFYLEQSRPLFLLPYQNRNHDFTIDGTRGVVRITDSIIEQLKIVYPEMWKD